MTKKQIEDIERAIRSSILRGVIYARVSTDKQEEDGTSLDMQVENCSNHALLNNVHVIEVFREVFPGSVYRERPLLTKLRQMAKNGEFDAIIINTFDRLSRNQTHMAVLIDEMEHLGIKILCVKEVFDKTSIGQFMRSAMSFVAQVEREKIASRTEEGRRRRVTELGKLNPGGKPRYGYRWADHNKERYILYDEEVPIVERIFNLYAYENGSCRGIAQMLTDQGIPSPHGGKAWWDSTIRHMLIDPTYIGKGTSFKWDTRTDIPGKYSMKLRPIEEQLPLPEGTVPAIVEESVFQLVQEKLKINANDSPRNNKHPGEAILRCGFIKCGYCLRTMTAGRGSQKRRKHPEMLQDYRCNYRYRGSKRCQEAPQISIQRIDAEVWEYVGEIIQDFSIVQEAISLLKKCNPEEPNLTGIEHSIMLAEASQNQLLVDLKQVDNDGLPKIKGRARQLMLDDLEKSEKYLEELILERSKILKGLVNFQMMQEDIDIFLAWCLNAKETYPTATYDEKRRALRNLGIEVFVYREDDEEHKRFDIRVRMPDIVRHRS